MSCAKCDPNRLCSRGGDVAMCVHCGQWWTILDATFADIDPEDAAAIARRPMPAEDVLAALERAAEEMEPEPDYYI